MSQLTNIPSYITWKQMKSRCSNPNFINYKNYGGRGITVCERWLDKTMVQVGEYRGGMGQKMAQQWSRGYINFIKDMGDRPKSTSLDRIDPNGNYNPENCRWATKHEQSANRRNNNETVGVSFDKTSGLWEGYLVVDSVRVFRMRSKDRKVVVNARKLAEIKYGL